MKVTVQDRVGWRSVAFTGTWSRSSIQQYRDGFKLYHACNALTNVLHSGLNSLCDMHDEFCRQFDITSSSAQFSSETGYCQAML